MAGPEDPAASRDQLRAGHADREQVTEALKDAFVHGRLTKDELDERAGEALSARTYADLAALTADITAGLAAPGPARQPVRAAHPPAPARPRPLARASAGSGLCLLIAAALLRVAFLVDPDDGVPHPAHSLAPFCLLLAFFAVMTALGIFIHGVGTAVEQRRVRRQSRPRPGSDGD